MCKPNILSKPDSTQKLKLIQWPKPIYIQIYIFQMNHCGTSYYPNSYHNKKSAPKILTLWKRGIQGFAKCVSQLKKLNS